MMNDLYRTILDQHNTLIAGTVGSGKTTMENGLIYTLLRDCTEADACFYLIDPKQFELRHFRRSALCRGYADTPEGALEILDTVERLRQARSNWMKTHELRHYEGNIVYLFIDELADLMLTDKKYAKEFTSKLAKIMQLGRALNIRVVALTQQPNRQVITALIQSCVTCTVGLHCRSAIESRQIVGMEGCEKLPKYGECYIAADGYVLKQNVPYVTEETIDAILGL